MLVPTAATRVAVEMLTLWMEPGDQARVDAGRHIQAVTAGPDGRPDPGATSRAIAGLLNLNIIVLLELAAERVGRDADFAAEARRFLQELSAKLPE